MLDTRAKADIALTDSLPRYRNIEAIDIALGILAQTADRKLRPDIGVLANIKLTNKRTAIKTATGFELVNESAER